MNYKIGEVKVKFNKEKPLWWYNYDCRESRRSYFLLPAIKIIHDDGTFELISNHCGIGINFVKRGGKKFPFSQDAEFVEYDFSCDELLTYYKIYNDFDEDCYVDDDIKRKLWQKEEKKLRKMVDKL